MSELVLIISGLVAFMAAAAAVFLHDCRRRSRTRWSMAGWLVAGFITQWMLLARLAQALLVRGEIVASAVTTLSALLGCAFACLVARCSPFEAVSCDWPSSRARRTLPLRSRAVRSPAAGHRRLRRIVSRGGTVTILLLSLFAGRPASAQTGSEAASTAPAGPAESRPWSLGDAIGLNDLLKPTKFTFSGYMELGFTANPDAPHDRLNFGRLFDDRSNHFRFNQLTLTLDRAMESGDKFDWGGRAQVMYGSDARFIHYTGEMDNLTNDTMQPTIVELFLTAHLPVLTKGGVDLKGGHFVTLMGAETIDPRTNYFYSHTYMFNFGIPFDHTGAMATIHLADNLHLMLGIVTGINTGFTDNNNSPSIHGGIAWNSSDSKWAVSSALHIGPENDSSVTAFNPDTALRYITDTVVTWNLDDRWQMIGDFVYGQDDGFNAEWYGAAGYVKYKINDKLSLVGRAEVFRDDDGFAVVQFGDNDDPANGIRGLPVNDPRTVGGGATTYYELTAGINYQPWANLMIRPEVRWDFADVQSGVAGGPFDDSRHTHQFTFGIDFILKF